jgi:hypothetical protein
VSGAPIDLVTELVSLSLAAWRVTGDVERTSDGAIEVAGKKAVRIEPGPQHSMFRWLVTIDGRQRGAISLLAVLRQVRQALDPGYAACGVSMAVAPLVPS